MAFQRFRFSFLFFVSGVTIIGIVGFATGTNPLRHKGRREDEREEGGVSWHRRSRSDYVIREWAETEKRDPPKYLSLLYKGLQSRNPGRGQGLHGPFLRTILPTLITHVEFCGTSIIFPINFDRNSGPNHKAEVILTRKADAMLHGANLSLSLRFRREQDIEEVLIPKESRFYIYTLNLTPLLLKENAQFKIEARLHRNKRRKSVPFERFFDVETDPPFLLFHFTPITINLHLEETRQRETVMPKKFRQKRHTRGDPSKCRKQEWSVKPADVGLHEVIAPTEIDLGFCSGDCQYPLMNSIYNYPSHAYFVDQYRVLRGSLTPPKVGTSTCVAVAYEPLMVMEEVSSGHYVFTIQDSLVQACGCRH